MMEKMPHTISNYIFPSRCGFIIGQKYHPIWVSVSVLDLKDNSGFGHTLLSANLLSLKIK